MIGLATLAALLSAPATEASFSCGTALSTCQVELDNGGRAWFHTPERLTEDALGDGTPKGGVFQVYERDGKTTRLIKGADGEPIPFDPLHRISARLIGVSPDGERVYLTTAASLTPEDSDPVADDSATDSYMLDDGRYTLLTTGPLDQPSTAPFANLGGNVVWASDDGRHVYFVTSSQMTAEDWDGATDIYERIGDQTRLVSAGPDEYLPTPEFPNPFVPDVRFLGASPDGATAYFATAAHLTPDEPGKSPSEGKFITSDIFSWRDGTTQRITRTVSPETVPGTPWESFDPYSFAGAGEGSVYFAANSGHVPEDTDQNRDVYRAKPDGSLERVISSPPAGPPPSQAFMGFLAVEAVSRDGSRLFLRSSQQLVPADRDDESDIYMWSEGRYELVSPKGDIGSGLEEELQLCSISNSGRRAYFQTWASLSAADSDEEPDVYEWSDGTIRLVSPASDGKQSAAFCSGISPNGRFVAFSTWEELIPGDNDVEQDIYVIDMGSAAAGASASASKTRPAKRRKGKRRLRLITAEAIPPRMKVGATGMLTAEGAALRIRCPKSERSGPCRGKATLMSRKGTRILARGRFKISSGRSAKVDLRDIALPGRRGSVTALARVRAADLLGNAATVTRTVDLRRAHQRRR